MGATSRQGIIETLERINKATGLTLNYDSNAQGYAVEYGYNNRILKVGSYWGKRDFQYMLWELEKLIDTMYFMNQDNKENDQ